MPYISSDPKGDRDILLRGGNLKRAAGIELKEKCFRNLFIEEEDVRIGKIVEQYFIAVRERWPKAWNEITPGQMLNRTNGFRALISLLGRAYVELAEPGEYVSHEDFFRLFRRVECDDEYFSTDRFLPGTSGESALRKFLAHAIFDDPELPLFRRN